MPAKELWDFLDSHHAKYVAIHHLAAFTAQEIAALAHVPGKDLAKTVMVEVDGKMAMAVLPASHKVDLGRLKAAAGAQSVALAAEAEGP